MIMPLNMNVLYKHTSQLTHRAYIFVEQWLCCNHNTNISLGPIHYKDSSSCWQQCLEKDDQSSLAHTMTSICQK
jgi:hypothetical protein